MTTLSANPHAAVVWWSELERWVNPDNTLRFTRLPKGWTVARLGDVIQQLSQREKVKPDGQYRMIGVKWYGQGTFHRETITGDATSASHLYRVIPGALIYNRLFAWKVSFAVVPQEHDGFFVSGEFPQFQVEAGKLLPEYLYLYCITDRFIRAVNAASVGSAAVSRNRFKEEEFLSFPIPLPPLAVQRAIVRRWQEAQAEIARAQAAIEKLQDGLEASLLRQIGIRLLPASPRKGAFAYAWSKLERWDTFFYRHDFVDLERQLTAQKARPLGELARFISRPWSRMDFPEGVFRYVEISGVTKEEGIHATTPVDVDKAPSRATTLIRAGDVLLSTTRPYLGAFAIVPTEYDNCVCTSGFAVADAVDKAQVDKRFLLHFLRGPAGLRQMERRMTGGLYPAIVQSELEKVRLPLLPLKTQIGFVAEAEKVEEQVRTERQAAAKLSAEVVKEVEEMILGTRPVKQ